MRAFCAREVRCGRARHTRGARRAGLGGGRRVVHAYRGMRSALISVAACRAERRPLGGGPGAREAARVASPRREPRRPPLLTPYPRRESLRAPIVAALDAGDCAHVLLCPAVLRRPPGWDGTETSGSGWRAVRREVIDLIRGCSVGVASQLAAFSEESGCSGTSCYLSLFSTGPLRFGRRLCHGRV
jgi:hypothetical protein